jgi:hypothetical protein
VQQLERRGATLTHAMQRGVADVRAANTASAALDNDDDAAAAVFGSLPSPEAYAALQIAQLDYRRDLTPSSAKSVFRSSPSPSSSLSSSSSSSSSPSLAWSSSPLTSLTASASAAAFRDGLRGGGDCHGGGGDNRNGYGYDGVGTARETSALAAALSPFLSSTAAPFAAAVATTAPMRQRLPLFATAAATGDTRSDAAADASVALVRGADKIARGVVVARLPHESGADAIIRQIHAAVVAEAPADRWAAASAARYAGGGDVHDSLVSNVAAVRVATAASSGEAITRAIV